MNTNVELKKNPQMDIQNDELVKINKELRKINKNFGFFQVISRGLLNGIATGIGATVGLAILLFLLARILSTFNDVPLINQLLTITKLNNVIEVKESQTDNIKTVVE